MSTETETPVRDTGFLNITPKKLGAGAVGGFIGSLLMGALMQAMSPGPLLMGIPAMYGIEGPSLAAGWAFHLFHGVFLGMLYVLAVENVGVLRKRSEKLGATVGFGVGYGVITTLLPILVMPVWLSALGFGGAPPFPNIAVPGTIMNGMRHVVYALSLALVYYFVTQR